MDSATALNRGVCCRCGSGRKGHPASEGLWTRCTQPGNSATAPNCGFCCRCGSGRKGHPASEGLWTRCTQPGNSATAPNCGICCRCGRRGERRASERSDYGIPSPGGFAPFGRTSPPAWRRALQKCMKKGCSNKFDSLSSCTSAVRGGFEPPVR